MVFGSPGLGFRSLLLGVGASRVFGLRFISRLMRILLSDGLWVGGGWGAVLGSLRE